MHTSTLSLVRRTYMRHKLSNRRPTITLVLETETDKYYVSFGLDLSDFTVREVFIRGSKIGSDMDILLDDASVVLSLALQYGVPLDQLVHSLHTGREEGGKSIVARVIALMNEEIVKIQTAIPHRVSPSLEDVSEQDHPAKEGEGVLPEA